MAYGNEKSSMMQDRIINRLDNQRRWMRREEQEVIQLPKAAWSQERWAARKVVKR